MTPEEIRAEAIERIARAEYDASLTAEGVSWDQAADWKRERFRSRAASHVDALGDLLPTGVEYKPDPTDWPTKYRPPWRRYVTTWREDPDA